jgi:glycosyltransferase involved in cell wall biosynthesis
MRLYYWIHHTGRYDRNTGVQRVVRNLANALTEAGHELIAVRWSAELEAVVRAERPWLVGLARFGGPCLANQADEGVPIHLAAADANRLSESWLLLPEVPHVGTDDAPAVPIAIDYARFYGLRTAAIFYDLVPIRHPGYEETTRAHEEYAHSLVAADLVAAISEHAASDLRSWWAEQGYKTSQLPQVVAAPLAAEMPGVPRLTAGAKPESPIRFAAVGTVEPRKNQVEVLRAYGRLRTRRPDLELQFDVVGGIHQAVASTVAEIAKRDPSVHIHDYLPDETLRELIASAQATIFLSLYEGFGLPIAESLWLGTPCISSDHGPMFEIAKGGGCLTVPARDGRAIEAALERMADDSGLRRRLMLEARARPLRRWREYAEEVVASLESAAALRQLVVLAGSRRSDARATEPMQVNALRHLHWRPESRALLPGTRDSPELPSPGDGQLAGLWATLSASSTAGSDELREILDEADRLGLRVALEAKHDVPSFSLASAELTVFPTPAERDVALARALEELPRTVGIRPRLEAAPNGHLAATIQSRDRRLSSNGRPRRPTRVYYWVGLTVQQPFNTGVQRVTRRLAAALQTLGVQLVPVKWDALTAKLAPISEEEAVHLARWSGPRSQPTSLPDDLRGEWLVIPEITVPVMPPGSNPARLGHELGMRVAALFYDLIPAKMPEHYPRVALEALDEYWRGFADVDLAIPISWSVTSDLLRWLADEGFRTPRVIPCVLAGDSGEFPRIRIPPQQERDEPLKLLAVGTWEPRKNYPRALRALKAAQERARRPIQLTIVGRQAGFDALDEEIEMLAAVAGVELLGSVDDEELRELHEEASATLFASWEEGFGLPVIESLWQARPCLCHAGSAMAEIVPGGGVLAVDMLNEQEITDALVALADDAELLARLGQEAVERPIRSWEEYAEDVLSALAQAGSPKGWALPAVVVKQGPLLTCAITTYNRAPWLEHSLARLLEVTRPWRDIVEVVVCDNASTDETPEVVARFEGEENFHSYRNPANVGMLGNLGATARSSRGAYVWLLGDDDLLIDGALENVLEGLVRHPEVEMAYMNYAYTAFDDPGQLDDVQQLLAQATPIANGGANRYVQELREVAGLNENLFTAIYTCAFRRDHALRAYQLDTRGAPFTSLSTCVPSSVYALAALQGRPAWWVGEPALVVNMNVSWLRWALLWHLERMPDLFEAAELQGIDPDRLDVYRLQHLVEAERWVRTTYFEAEDAIRGHFSLARLLERTKHLPEFRARHLEGVRRAYEDAWAAGRVLVDPIPPAELFARYGL